MTVLSSADGLQLDPQHRLVADDTVLPGGVSVHTDAHGTVWQYSDLHGDPWFSATATGTATGTPHLYDPFGLALDAADPASPGDALGLVQHGDRTYVAALGRFTTPDPEIGGAANPYDYAGQDPVDASDPDGHSVLGDVLSAVAGALVVGVLMLVAAPIAADLLPAGVTALSNALIATGWLGRVAASAVRARALLSTLRGARAFAVNAAVGFDAGAVVSGALTGAGTGALTMAAADAAGQAGDGDGWSWARFGGAVAHGAEYGAALGLLGRSALAAQVNRSMKLPMLPLWPWQRSYHKVGIRVFNLG